MRDAGWQIRDGGWEGTLRKSSKNDVTRINFQEVSTRLALPWNHVSSVLQLLVVTDFSLCLILQGLETPGD